METTAIQVLPLSPLFGAEVRGLDLREPQPEPVKAQLREAFLRYSLLLFRGQQLSSEEQMAVGRIFGTISYQGENYKESDGTRYVSNVAEDGLNKSGELTFHIDHSFYDTPLRAIMLYALEAPPPGAGGETLFSSMKLAYDALAPEVKARLEGLQAFHCYDYDVSRNVRQSDRFREQDLGPLSTRAIHPVVLTHPGTGQKVLFISRRHVDRILGLDEPDSEALLAQLVAAIERPEGVLGHTWQPGDLVIWDNLTLQHARTNFDSRYRRHLRRCQVA